MKRTVWIVAVVALCVAGSAVAQDRSQWMGNGGRAEDGQMMGSGNVAGQILGSGGVTTQDSGQILGSGTRSEAGGFLGSGNRTTDGGGTIGSGTRSEDSGQVIGSSSRVTAQDGGYLIGGGLSVLQFRLLDGSSLLVVTSDEGTFGILIEE